MMGEKKLFEFFNNKLKERKEQFPHHMDSEIVMVIGIDDLKVLLRLAKRGLNCKKQGKVKKEILTPHGIQMGD